MRHPRKVLGSSKNHITFKLLALSYIYLSSMCFDHVLVLHTAATKKERVPKGLEPVRIMRHLMKVSLAHYVAK